MGRHAESVLVEPGWSLFLVAATEDAVALLKCCGRTDQVATYEYHCDDCGTFERSMPMGSATQSAICPTCGRDGKRVFSVPMTYRTPESLAAMLTREEASRDYPEVIERVPPTNRPRHPTASQDLLARLPKL